MLAHDLIVWTQALVPRRRARQGRTETAALPAAARRRPARVLRPPRQAAPPRSLAVDRSAQGRVREAQDAPRRDRLTTSRRATHARADLPATGRDHRCPNTDAEHEPTLPRKRSETPYHRRSPSPPPAQNTADRHPKSPPSAYCTFRVSADVVRALKRRRSGGDQLLAYRERRRWHGVRSEQISEYLKQQIGDQYSAKDFRTWNATVLATVSVAADGREATSKRARKRAIDGAVRGVAEVLGNTPAVARRSYIDPRVFDRYLSGWTIGGELDRIGELRGPDDRRRARLERAVLDLLHDDRASPAVQRDAA